MKYKITLKDTRSNEVKELIQDYDYDEYGDEEAYRLVEFMWEEGNYSCDCNRFIFMYDADVSCNTGENVIEVMAIERIE